MNKEEIKEEYKKYCEDKNVESDKHNFIIDYIKYNYDLGKLKISDILDIYVELEKMI